MLFFMPISLLRIFTKYGQGGALIEQGSAQAPLINLLADITHWHWGVFYVCFQSAEVGHIRCLI